MKSRERDNVELLLKVKDDGSYKDLRRLIHADENAPMSDKTYGFNVKFNYNQFANSQYSNNG